MQGRLSLTWTPLFPQSAGPQLGFAPTDTDTQDALMESSAPFTLWNPLTCGIRSKFWVEGFVVTQEWLPRRQDLRSCLCWGVVCRSAGLSVRAGVCSNKSLVGWDEFLIPRGNPLAKSQLCHHGAPIIFSSLLGFFGPLQTFQAYSFSEAKILHFQLDVRWILVIILPAAWTGHENVTARVLLLGYNISHFHWSNSLSFLGQERGQEGGQSFPHPSCISQLFTGLRAGGKTLSIMGGCGEICTVLGSKRGLKKSETLLSCLCT